MSSSDLYSQICTYNNIYLAYRKARKGKTLKQYVIDFEENLEENLLQLRFELLFRIYGPKPLQTFILRDPKTRKINKSAFRDRVVHHALCNIITPIFQKRFIFDSYANQIGKGTFKAINRFQEYSCKVTKNFHHVGFVLKADIKKYFEYVDHTILFSILKRRISDPRVLWLIKIILKNYVDKIENKGMPLGNLTSQFFANVYLHELDFFVKQKLGIKYYIRYVDDFVIIEKSRKKLHQHLKLIDYFLEKHLALTLHPQKSRVLLLHQGVEFLGIRIFSHYRILKIKNLRKFRRRLNEVCMLFDQNVIEYDVLYDLIEGWCAYAKNAHTFKLRQKVVSLLEEKYRSKISTKEINRYARLTGNKQKK